MQSINKVNLFSIFLPVFIFLPPIYSSLRLDDLFFVFFVPFAILLYSYRIRISRIQLLVLLGLLFLLLRAIIYPCETLASTLAIADLLNLFVFFSLLAFFFCFPRLPFKINYKLVSFSVVIFLCVNAALALVNQIYFAFNASVLLPLTEPLLGGARLVVETDRDIIVDSLSSFRSWGVFNLPTEAAYSYLLGFFIWFKYFYLDQSLSSFVKIITFVFLFLGALLTASKLFVFVIILFFLYRVLRFCFSLKMQRYFLISALSIVGTFTIMAISLGSSLQNFSVFRLFSSIAASNRLEAFLYATSAGRLTDSYLPSFMQKDISSILFGLGPGFTVITGASDSEFLYLLYITGICGMVAFLLSIYILFLELYSRNIFVDKVILRALFFVVLFSMLGGNVLLGNRTPILTLLTIYLIFTDPTPESKSDLNF